MSSVVVMRIGLIAIVATCLVLVWVGADGRLVPGLGLFAALGLAAAVRQNPRWRAEQAQLREQADRAWAERSEGATWRKPVGVAAVVLAIGFTVANTYTEEMNHVGGGVMTPLGLAGIGCLSVAFILLWLGRPRAT